MRKKRNQTGNKPSPYDYYVNGKPSVSRCAWLSFAIMNADTMSPDGIQARLDELQDFIGSQQSEITEFDESLVRRLVEKITVFPDHFTVEFRSGVTVDIKA